MQKINYQDLYYIKKNNPVEEQFTLADKFYIKKMNLGTEKNIIKNTEKKMQNISETIGENTKEKKEVKKEIIYGYKKEKNKQEIKMLCPRCRGAVEVYIAADFKAYCNKCENILGLYIKCKDLGKQQQ